MRHVHNIEKLLTNRTDRIFWMRDFCIELSKVHNDETIFCIPNSFHHSFPEQVTRPSNSLYARLEMRLHSRSVTFRIDNAAQSISSEVPARLTSF